MPQITWLQTTLCLIGLAMQAIAIWYARRYKSGMPATLAPAKVAPRPVPNERPAVTPPGPFSLTAHLPPYTSAPHLRRDQAMSKPSPESAQVRPGLLTKTEKVSFVR